MVVLQRAVPAGEALAAADVSLAALPPPAVPDGALASTQDAVGQTLAVPVAAGTVLQPALLARAATAAAKGRAVVPILIADDDLRRLLAAPGDLISLVSAHGESPEIVTGDARVVALPCLGGSGALRAAASTDRGTLVDVPASSATLVALLGQGGQLSVILGSTDG